ncbi:MAG: hypothetical protein QW687_00710 [Candidatus Hadarchaeales archaeon]
MRDELRKEIRSLIWKTFVDARLNTLKKRDRRRDIPLKKQDEIVSSEVEVYSEREEKWEDLSERIDEILKGTKDDSLKELLTEIKKFVEELLSDLEVRAGLKEIPTELKRKRK